MTWCNIESDEERGIQIISPESTKDATTSTINNDLRTITCPSCGHHIQLQDQAGGIHDLPGLPAGVKFDPTDQEILEHLEAKVLSDSRKLHPLIDEFIPTLQGENGICYTHPENLPGVSKDGQIRHFFHRPSKAYTTGTRKRRKVNTDEDGSETRWHKTGKTRPVFVGGTIKGFKKILVLYTNYGRQKKPEKTNWVMHQYHLGNDEEEKDGELVASKVFYQTQPRQCGSSIKETTTFDHTSINIQSSDHHPLAKKATTDHHHLMEYYNPNSFLNYDHHHHLHHQSECLNIGESPTQFIPNLVVQGDDSSFIRLNTPGTSKSRVETK